MGEDAGGWDFFVSYAQVDRGWAEWIAWQLEADGYQVLIQAWDMVPGSNWTHQMQRGLRQASRTIAVLSAAYLESVFATAEWQAAWQDDPLGEQRKLLVFRIAACDRPGLLGGVVGIDLFDTKEIEASGRIRSAVRSAVTGRAKPVHPPVFPLQPRLAPRFPGPLPAVWNVPPRNPNFTGREVALGHVRAELVEHPAVTVHALHGMGGIGKTQTAIEYAYRYAGEYNLVWWINAEQAALAGDQFAILAEELGLQLPGNPEAMLRAVRRTLRGRDRWLLIFDNAADASDIAALLPGGAGHVLITTRRGGFRSLGGILDLDILGRPEAVALLRRLAPVLTDTQADQLAARLGDLPLALGQAAAYLDWNSTPPEEYLRMLDTHGADLYSREHVPGHSDTIATVWSVSLDRLRETAPAAVQLLELCAWLGPEPIPLDLFTDHCDQLPEPLASIAADPYAFSDAVGALVGYSLARRAGGTLDVHRLIQDVTRHHLASQPGRERDERRGTVLALLRADLSGDPGEAESWHRWRALLPGVLAAAGDHAGLAGEQATASLLTKAGIYLTSQGRYAEALPLYERALRIDESILGPDALDVATDLNYVGRALSNLGRAAEALLLHERALRIHEAALGPDALDVATDLNHIGQALSDLGRTADALRLYKRALRIDEAALNRNDLDLAVDLNFVGRALLDLKRAAEALPLHQRALRILGTLGGHDDSYVATTLNYAGEALSDLNRSAEALPLQERALAIDEAILGPDHPEVATDLSYVGRALLDVGRAAEALPLQERALAIDEAILGPDHPGIATDLDHVARTLSELGRAAEALPFRERALRIRGTAVSPDQETTF